MSVKILFVLSSLGQGGIENYVLRFIRELEESCQICILTKKNCSYSLISKELEELGAQVVCLKVSPLNLFSIWRFISFLKAGRFSTICDFTGDYAGSVLIAGSLAGVKNRYSFYRESRPQYKPSIGKDIFTRLSRALVALSSTMILMNSKEAMRYYFSSTWIKKKLAYIPNGYPKYTRIDKTVARHSLGLPESGLIIGHMGRVVPAKNHDLLLAISQRLSHSNVNHHLLLAGTGVSSLNIEDVKAPVVRFDHLSSITHFFSSLDVFLFPSLNEGQPNVVFEAMIHKTPVILSDIPANRDIGIVPEFLLKKTDAQLYAESIVNEEYLRYDLEETRNAVLKEYGLEHCHGLFKDLVFNE